MSHNNSRTKVIYALWWKFAERILAQVVSFFVSIILARLLSPHDYGAISLVMIFITICNVFILSGFGSALIQKKNADNLDFSSVFYFNIVFSAILYGVLFIMAPIIAKFYHMESITYVIRILGLIIIISGINSVQQAYISRNMLFRRSFWSTLLGTIMSGVVGILMAYKGWGVWALVIQYLTNNFVDTFVLWFTVKWRPTWNFSRKRMKSMFQYGWKLLCSGLLDTIYGQLRNLLIGMNYSPSDLAFYDKGNQYPGLIVNNINSSISSVLFPAISQEQDNIQKVKSMTQRAIRISSYMMWPMMMGLAVISKPLITLMLTDKWIPCVPYLQIACFVYGFWPIHTANLEAMKAVGRSDLFLKLEIIKKIMGVTILILAMGKGVMAIAMSAIATTIISTFINAYPNRKLLQYPYMEQMKDIGISVLLSLCMGTIIYPIKFFIENNLILVIVQVILGASIYILASWLLDIEQYKYIIGIIKKVKRVKSEESS